VPNAYVAVGLFLFLYEQIKVTIISAGSRRPGDDPRAWGRAGIIILKAASRLESP
jgi:hypothetical protein